MQTYTEWLEALLNEKSIMEKHPFTSAEWMKHYRLLTDLIEKNPEYKDKYSQTYNIGHVA